MAPASTAVALEVIPVERIASRIYVIRRQKVMIDSDLAELYDVLTKNLNLAVRRNKRRFPEDFMFRLTAKEAQALRLQNATSKSGGRGGRRYVPYVFTEQGVAMLSSVLKSERAADVNVMIMRTFVRLRNILATNEDLARRVAMHDHKINVLCDQVQKLLAPPKKRKKYKIGFAAVQA